MNALTSLIDGFGHALTQGNLLFAAVGVLLGTAIGVLPGIGPAMAQALATAAIGHFVGGMIGTTLLVLLAPLVASLAVNIGAPDFFAVMVLAFVAVTSVLGRSRVRGFAALGIGLAIGLVGLDPVSGARRLKFGIPPLADGIDVVIVAVALFAVGEALWVAAH